MGLFKTNKQFLKSLWVFHCNGASCNGCDIEIVAALTPRYDAERFGIKLVGSPRHADVLVMTGPVNRQMEDKVKLIYEQTPGPKACLIVGVCGTTGGVFHNSYNLVGPLDKVIKAVDPAAHIVYVPGCPARPEAIIWGVVRAMAHLEPVLSPEVLKEYEDILAASGASPPVDITPQKRAEIAEKAAEEEAEEDSEDEPAKEESKDEPAEEESEDEPAEEESKDEPAEEDSKDEPAEEESKDEPAEEESKDEPAEEESKDEPAEEDSKDEPDMKDIPEAKPVEKKSGKSGGKKSGKSGGKKSGGKKTDGNKKDEEKAEDKEGSE